MQATASIFLEFGPYCEPGWRDLMVQDAWRRSLTLSRLPSAVSFEMCTSRCVFAAVTCGECDCFAEIQIFADAGLFALCEGRLRTVGIGMHGECFAAKPDQQRLACLPVRRATRSTRIKRGDSRRYARASSDYYSTLHIPGNLPFVRGARVDLRLQFATTISAESVELTIVTVLPAVSGERRETPSTLGE